MPALTPEQLTGRNCAHLQELPDGNQLGGDAAAAFSGLQNAARAAGFQLAIASSFRSFERQCQIWNDKALGERPVYNDAGQLLSIQQLRPEQKMHAILRYSALPGTSRHHWGTDLDVFDASAMPDGYELQLSPEEVDTGGLFDPLHCWLDERMAADESFGFFRPYQQDLGGVAPERWHLSYAPDAACCEAACTSSLLRETLAGANLQLWPQVEANFDALLAQYVNVNKHWCPAHYR